jgi:predicted HTH domain antitoxin
MAKALVEIPDRFADALEPYRDRLGELLALGLTQVRIQEALLFYGRGIVSFGRAAELSGVSEDELTAHARAHGVAPRWSEEMAIEELK